MMTNTHMNWGNIYSIFLVLLFWKQKSTCSQRWTSVRRIVFSSTFPDSPLWLIFSSSIFLGNLISLRSNNNGSLRKSPDWKCCSLQWKQSEREIIEWYNISMVNYWNFWFRSILMRFSAQKHYRTHFVCHLSAAPLTLSSEFVNKQIFALATYWIRSMRWLSFFVSRK